MMFEELGDFRRDAIDVESDLRVRIVALESVLDELRDRLREVREQTQDYKAILEDDGPFDVRPEELTVLEEDMRDVAKELDVLQPRLFEFRELAIELNQMVKWSVDQQRKYADDPENFEWDEVEAKLEDYRKRLDEIDF